MSLQLTKTKTETEYPKYTAIIACREDFDIKLSNAAQTTRLGYCHGFPMIGVTAALVKYHGLIKAAESCEHPIFWLAYNDFNFMSDATIEMLKIYPHIVQVNTWFDGMEEVHREVGAPSPAIHHRTLKRLLDSHPNFVWCSAPEAYFNSYEGWIEEAGVKLVSLPWACDSTRYYICPSEDKFTGSIVSFVGGYREYKESQYEQYLWPYEERLKIWGYSEWPKCYQGYLDNNEEKWLYQNSVVCPTISEPQFAITGDTVERPFKVMGSGGLTVFDCNPAYTHLFEPGEALIPETIEMYHDFMEAITRDMDLNLKYRKAGFQAVMERHTYAHRCRKIMMELGL